MITKKEYDQHAIRPEKDFNRLLVGDKFTFWGGYGFQSFEVVAVQSGSVTVRGTF